MKYIVDTLVTWLQWEGATANNLQNFTLPYYAVLPRKWEAMMPELAKELNVHYNFIWLVMSQLYWRQGKNLTDIEIWMIITEVVDEFRRS